MLLAMVATPVATQGQLTFTTNNGAVTVTGYSGPGGRLIIPSATNGLLTQLGFIAFGRPEYDPQLSAGADGRLPFRLGWL
jgi:hypothetical protein